MWCRLFEWMVSGWNECDCVARAPCNTGWKLNCSQLLWNIYIYTTIGVCEKDQRDKREKTGIKSVCLEDCFRLHWNQQHYIWRRPTCKEPAVVLNVKTAACQNRWERQHVFSADAPAEPWVPPLSWAFVLSCHRCDNGCSPAVVTTMGVNRSFLHRPDVVEFFDLASDWRRWAPPTALGSSNIASTALMARGPSCIVLTALGPSCIVLTALGPSCIVSMVLGPSCIASTALGPFCIVLTALGPFCIVLTALGPFCIVLTALGPSCIMLTALGPSCIAVFPLHRQRCVFFV